MYKYLLIALFLFGCQHMPWADDPEPEPTPEEQLIDCIALAEAGASHAKFIACIQQADQAMREQNEKGEE